MVPFCSHRITGQETSYRAPTPTLFGHTFMKEGSRNYFYTLRVLLSRPSPSFDSESSRSFTCFSIISLDVVLRQRIRGMSAFHTVSPKVQVDEALCQKSQGSKGGKKMDVCSTAVRVRIAPFGGSYNAVMATCIPHILLLILLQLSHLRHHSNHAGVFCP